MKYSKVRLLTTVQNTHCSKSIQARQVPKSLQKKIMYPRIVFYEARFGDDALPYVECYQRYFTIHERYHHNNIIIIIIDVLEHK